MSSLPASTGGAGDHALRPQQRSATTSGLALERCRVGFPFLTERAQEARALVAAEEKRRGRKAAKAEGEGAMGPLFADDVLEPQEAIDD